VPAGSARPSAATSSAGTAPSAAGASAPDRHRGRRVPRQTGAWSLEGLRNV
jgi:hypothetical protein